MKNADRSTLTPISAERRRLAARIGWLIWFTGLGFWITSAGVIWNAVFAAVLDVPQLYWLALANLGCAWLIRLARKPLRIQLAAITCPCSRCVAMRKKSGIPE